MRTIHVLFYTPSSEDFWLNHLVTMFDPPFSHCDIQFEDGTASGVYQGETVYWEKKSFSRQGYTRMSLAVDEQEYQKVWKFCRETFVSKISFDPMGMAMSISPIPLRKPATRTFCSRYILEALQKTGRPEFTQHNPCLISPSGLHAILKETGKGFLDVSEKRMATFMHSGVTSANVR